MFTRRVQSYSNRRYSGSLYLEAEEGDLADGL